MSLLAKSVFLIWLLTAVGAFVVGLLSSAQDYLTYLPAVLSGALLVTLSVQLALKRKEGFVERVTASIAGSVLILTLATAVLLPISLSA